MRKTKWVNTIIKELESLINRKTIVKMTRKQANDLYWRNGIKTKDVPSNLVCCKKHDHETVEEWKAKARITACGCFEFDVVFTHLSNRSEVPDAFMLRAMLSYGAGTD